MLPLVWPVGVKNVADVRVVPLVEQVNAVP